MQSATLDDFMSWNEQLAAAMEADVPLDLGLHRTAGGAAGALEKINAVVARRMSQGMSLAAALQDDDPAIPPAYRCLAQLSLASEKAEVGMALSNRLARKVNRTWNIGRLALLYPTIVCSLAFAGLVGFCLYLVPVLEETYAGLDVKTGSGLRVLEFLRGSLPYWGAIFPAGLVLATIWVARTSKTADERQRQRVLDWIPGVARAVYEERAANFADTMATLLDSGAAFPAALKIAASAWNDSPQALETRAFLAKSEDNSTAVSSTAFAQRLPPFLRWALLDSESTTGRVVALKAAANVYRQAASRRQQRLRAILPLMLAVLIGGLATLLYGLALFVPVIDMLRSLATQYAG